MHAKLSLIISKLKCQHKKKLRSNQFCICILHTIGNLYPDSTSILAFMYNDIFMNIKIEKNTEYNI